MPLAARLTVRSTYELIRETASKDPERTAITLLHGIHQTANLLADLGVESGDVIALLLPKLLESHLLLWRGQVAGIVCPIHPHLPVEQTIALLGATKAKVLVAPGPQVDQELWQKAEEVRHQVESLIHLYKCGAQERSRTPSMPSKLCWGITLLTTSTTGASSPLTT